MVPIFVLTTILVVKVRKSLRDGKGHGIEKNRCDVSMIGDARQDSSEKGLQEIGDFGYKAGMSTFIAKREWEVGQVKSCKMQIPYSYPHEGYLYKNPVYRWGIRP